MSLTKHPSGLSAEQITEMLELAAQTAERSYAPYSKFRVGAAILLDDGSIFTGCNVENASYRVTTCAEQTAIAKAMSEVGPKIRLRAVAVANLNGAASMPCGACRQTILEFGSPDTWIFFPGEDGPTDVSLAQLLPYGFHLAHD
ncbi:MAG: cytidine deaminase [Acidobacteriaceae bacterium]|jgi:cytidine deaminase|nr:cytidine deaminase [Acidobacteriaceae bacterium]